MDKRYVKRISLLIVVLLFLLQGMTVFAASEYVIDEAGILNSVQKEDLEEKCEEFVDDWDIDLLINLTNDTRGLDIEDYTEYLFDNEDIGIRDNDEDIIIFAIDVAGRKYDFYKSDGDVELELNAYSAYIVDEFISYLSDDEFNAAIETFIDVTDEVLRGQHLNEIDRSIENNLTYFQKVKLNFKIVWFYVIPVVIAIIVVVLVTISSKGKVTITNRTYETEDSFRVTNRVDQFISEPVP